ncbi:competence protein CoiA [Aquibacillus saliphilus]|uniref:competence protein CoiA n=1 Tax=Aquibacillus saliphilus TaxID=1909422 RepID=UPI001CF06B18|nr:competence protein CoiA family protein [Aquibacillus saliphilus]
MLQALNQHGKLQLLALMSPSEIIQHKIHSKFFCPTCKEHVLIKAGEKVTPHFAHHPKSECPAKKGGEGEYHERGKLNLYYWLLRQGISAQLEVFIGKIQQRPDILVEINNKLIAIEFQCAKISANDVRKRSTGYKNINITPIWILGGNRLIRKGSNSLSTNNFELLFLHQFHNNYPPTIFFYCPSANQFSIFQHIVTTDTKWSHGNLKFKKLNDLTFYQLFKRENPNNQQLLSDWKLVKFNFRTRVSPHPTKLEMKWREWLYLKNIHPSLLPSVVHLPVPSQFMMLSPPPVWQSKICIEVINNSNRSFTTNLCYSLLKADKKPQSFYPLINGLNDPIKEYLLLLVKLQYLKQVNPTTFHVIKKPKSHHSIEYAIEQDEQLINSLLNGFKPSTNMHV